MMKTLFIVQNNSVNTEVDGLFIGLGYIRDIF